jgi:hypothetical protein
MGPVRKEEFERTCPIRKWLAASYLPVRWEVQRITSQRNDGMTLAVVPFSSGALPLKNKLSL